MEQLPDHPVIRWMERTGEPRGYSPQERTGRRNAPFSKRRPRPAAERR